MAQVPMRMAQPGLVPPHQQRPPMMVNMTQPPPVSMQGLVSMAPMMGPGGGMAVMTQAMNHHDSGHEHHSMNGPYHHPHHHHPHHPPHAAAPPPRPHGPPQTHHPVPPPHHPSGPPPPQSTHSAPPHSQYHPLPSGPHHGPPPHGGPHSIHHSAPHSHSSPHSGPHMASHSNSNGSSSHGIPQHLQSGSHMSQSSHTMTHHSAPHQMNGLSPGTMNSSQPQHHQQHHPQHTSHHHPPPQPPPPPLQQPMHQQLQPMQHTLQQSQSQPMQQHPVQHIQHQQHPSHHQQSIHPTAQHQQPHTADTTSSGGGGVIILSNTNNSSSGGPMCNNIGMGTNQNTPPPPPQTQPQTIDIPTTNNLSINGVSSVDCQILSNLDSSVSTREKTPMCLINELARYNKIQHQYCLTDEKGPAHKKIFTVTLRLGENEEEYSASGPSIKKAQHSAAAIALEKTKLKRPPPKMQRHNRQTKLTPTVELNALAMKRGEAAMYTFLETPRPPNPYTYNMPPNIRAVYSQKYYGRSPVYPMFFVNLKVGSREFAGEGATAQQAKHNAASKALKSLKVLPVPDENRSIADLTQLDPNAELKSPISLVHEIALKRNLTVIFEVVRESGPPHMRTFVTTCIVGEIRTQGEGTGKKISKKRAAELMLEELKKLPPLTPISIARVKRKPVTKKKSRNLIKEQKAAPEYGQGINPISRLIQIQQAKKEKEPIYTLLVERGVPRRREFVMQVTVGSNCAQGSGPNKKFAKRAAAESMLQLLGYSRPPPQPGKPAIKMDGTHSESDKTRKQVTFSEETTDSSRVVSNDCSQSSMQNQSVPSGSGRQLVPGLIMMPDGSSALHGYQQMQQPGMNIVNLNQMVNMQATAAIAKELLESGNSPTAKAFSKKQGNGSHSSHQETHMPTQSGNSHIVSHQQQTNVQANNPPPLQTHLNHQPMMQSPPSHPQVSIQQHQPQPQMQSPPPQPINNTASRNGLTISGNTTVQAVRPKDQLMYLANILSLQVQFTDFPKGNKSEYLSLVSLSTMPPHVSHGAGPTIDMSHDQACLTALKALAEMGLDTVTSGNRDGTKSN